MVTAVDQSIAELPNELRLNRAVFRFREVTAANSALVGDDDQFVSVPFEEPQRVRCLREHFYLRWVTTVIDIAHQRSITVEKDGRPALVRRAGHFENWR